MPEYLYTNLPRYITVTPRSAFANSVVQSGSVLLFSEDGTTLTAKLPDGSFIAVGGSGGTDVSDTTATAATVLSGYDFYLANGTKTSGTIQTVTASQSGNIVTVPAGYIAAAQTLTIGTAKAAATYTPTTSDQTITAGQYLTGDQTIKGDANLLASNIVQGVTIFGVTGTASGGGSTDFYKCASVSGDVPEIKSPEDATGSTGTGYTISASSIFNSNYDGWKAFNGAVVASDIGWFSEQGDSDPQWLQIQFTTAQVINFYSFNVAYDSASQHYSAWKLQASNDGTTWTDLDVVTGQDLYSDDSAYSSYLNNSTAYTYYRIYFAGTGGYSYIGLQNVKLGYLSSVKTWTGYKAVFDSANGVYSFESSVTSGRTWSNALRPQVGKVYNDGATVQATLPQIILMAHLNQNLNLEGGGSMTAGGIITYSAGKSGYAASVDQDNYINTGLSTSALQGDFTIDFWVKIPDTTTRFAPLAGYTDAKIGIDSYRGYWNIWAGNNGWNILQADDAGYDDSGNGSIACTTDWTHIAYVHSGNDWYLFVNGQLSVHKVRQGDVAGNVDVCIGRWGGGGFSSTPILIDELRICNKALWTADFTPPGA